MKSKLFLESQDIKAVAAAAEAEAIKHQWAVSIAIVDDGGHLLWFSRLDGAAPVSSHIAPAKARTAALGRRESKGYEDMINGGRYSFLSAPGLEGMLEGGVPILRDGVCRKSPRRVLPLWVPEPRWVPKPCCEPLRLSR